MIDKSMKIIKSTDRKKKSPMQYTKWQKNYWGKKKVMALYIVQWNIANLVKRPVPMKYWMRVSTTLSVL
jgi:hypothetical protein